MRGRVLLWIWIAACADTHGAGPDAELAEDADARDAADAENEDASTADGGAPGDASDFLTMPAFDDAASPDACNRVLNDGPALEMHFITEALPRALGGSIAEGVYERVAVSAYAASGGDAGSADATGSAVLWLTRGEFHFSESLGPGPDQHLSGTIAQQGTQLILTRTCPLPKRISPYDRFDASERELVFYSSSLQRTITYRRR
jgi:hypothetical protein